MVLFILRWTLVVSIFSLVGIGLWTVMTVVRIRQEQSIAHEILKTLMARAELKKSIDTLQKKITEETPNGAI